MKNNSTVQFILVLLVSLAVGLTIRKTCFSIHRIVGKSMMPTFNDGAFVFTMERPLMNLLGVKINRGDLVIAEINGNLPVAKRAMGFGGEEIWVEDFKVYLNGEAVKEDFKRLVKNKVDCGFTEVFTVPLNHIFIMGDNYCESFDSRYFGAISSEAIKGKMIWTIYRGRNEI